ncbi:MAG: hypothetical protein AB7I38_05350 [Dehalococcoidia bacterium]
MIRRFIGGSIAAAALAALLVLMPAQGGTVQAQTGGIIAGNKPPAAGGFGSFAFGGGTFAQLLDASGCPQATSAFFHNKPDGSFVAYIPGTSISVVNQDVMALFPNDTIPNGTIFIGRCV